MYLPIYTPSSTMQTIDAINPSVVAQSAIALSVAIVVTDAIRECVLAVRPESAVGFAALRIAVAITLVIVVIFMVGKYRRGSVSVEIKANTKGNDVPRHTDYTRGVHYTPKCEMCGRE